MSPQSISVDGAVNLRDLGGYKTASGHSVTRRRSWFMTNVTAELIRDHADDYAQMFQALLDLEEGAFLVHCASGKDEGFVLPRASRLEGNQLPPREWKSAVGLDASARGALQERYLHP